MTTTAITWAWGTHQEIAFDPSKDVLDFGWIGSQYFTVSEVNGSVVIDIPVNNHSYTLTGVTLADLSMANITASDTTAYDVWTAAFATVGTTTDIAWAWDTDTVLAFDPATDKLDFGWVSANDFSLAEANGSVVIYLPANHQTYVLEGVTLAELSLSNIVGQDSTALAEWSAALAAGTTAGAHLSGSTAITWDYGIQKVIDFDPATDTLDFGWLSSGDFAVTEVNGSVTILLPTNHQSYTLDGVTLADLSLANVTGKDGTAFAEWAATLAADAAGRGVDITPVTWDYGAQTTLDFDPASDKLDLGSLTADDFSIAEVNGSVVILLASNQHSYTLGGVTLADLSAANILASDSGAFAEWASAIASSAAGGVGGDDGATVTPINWAWATNTVLDFDPATDTLDFQYVSADDFSVAEVNGSVVIYLPANHQSYILEGVTLSEMTLANVTGQDATALAEWGTLVAPAPVADGGAQEPGGTTEPSDPVAQDPVAQDPETGTGDTGTGSDTSSDTPTAETPTSQDSDGMGSSGGDVDTVYADAWSADTIYWGGDQVSVGNVVYEAKWWTLDVDPETNNGPDGSGNVWGVVGFMSPTPVVPEAPDDLQALTTTETSTVLSWDAPEIKGVGTLSGYAIYEDGELIATTTDRTYKVTGLSADTTYHFTVAAIDEAGASDASVPLSVTTEAAGSDGPDGQYFAPYAEMWLPSSGDLVHTVEEAGLTSVTLAFVIGTGDNQIGWAGIGGTLADDTLANGTSISSMVDELHAKGVDVSISFGGGLGQEPALFYDNADDLAAAYRSVIDTYHVTHLDFDVEGDALSDTAASARRAEALASLEEANPDLSVSFTLPVLPTGLTQEGLDLLTQAHAAGVDIDTVNIMVMDYGDYNDSGDMGDDAIDAAEATIAQLHALGIDAQVALTPMIGVNDIPGETFTLEDAQQLVDYADGNDHIAYLAMWSIGRDHDGGVGDLATDHSGVSQLDYEFSKVFATV